MFKNPLFPLKDYRPLTRFFLALIPSTILMLGHDYLPPIVRQTPAILHYPAVFFATWLGGTLPGVISISMSMVLATVIHRPHLLTFPISDFPNFSRIIIFIFTSLGFVGMMHILRKALDRANVAIAVRDDFLSLISHELKTPLTALKLNIDIISRIHMEEFPDSPSKAQIESSVRQIGRLERMIVSLMDLTMLDSGHLGLLKRQSDLKKIVQDAASAQNYPSIKFLGSDESLLGYWDPVRIEQVASNIIHNAIKYGHNKPVEIDFGSEGNYVWFSVKDYGAGIDKKDHQIIFNRFQRVNTCTDVQGMGLGLYLTKNLVELHKGEIELKSKPGEGSYFKVRLPVSVE